MYAESFGLNRLPFNNTCDPRFFYASREHEEALASLIYLVGEMKGLMLLTGEAGTGKSLLAHLMIRHFERRIVQANVCCSNREEMGILPAICREFGLETEGKNDRTSFTRALQEFLLEHLAHQTPTVLVLDEAQHLSAEALEELRLVSNMEADNAKLLQIVIIGQSELREQIVKPQLRQLRQRLFRSVHLSAFDRAHTERYIQYRLTVASAGEKRIFKPSAFDPIFEISHGIPRVINTICDNAMLTAFAAGETAIDGDMIRSMADLDIIVEPPLSHRDAHVPTGATSGTHANLPSPVSTPKPNERRHPTPNPPAIESSTVSVPIRVLPPASPNVLVITDVEKRPPLTNPLTRTPTNTLAVPVHPKLDATKVQRITRLETQPVTPKTTTPHPSHASTKPAKPTGVDKTPRSGPIRVPNPTPIEPIDWPELPAYSEDHTTAPSSELSKPTRFSPLPRRPKPPVKLDRGSRADMPMNERMDLLNQRIRNFDGRINSTLQRINGKLAGVTTHDNARRNLDPELTTE